MKIGKISKSKSEWKNPYPEHPTDKLKIRLLLDEKIKGNRIIGLEARIDPGKIHQLHFHKNEYVVVYTVKGRCKVTAGNKTQIVLPRTIIFLPPKVPHRFENHTKRIWEGIAFAIGTKSKINNVWMD